MHSRTGTKTHSPSDGLLTQCIRISLEFRFAKIGEIHSKECTILIPVAVWIPIIQVYVIDERNEPE